jgi:hypothetical protein
MEAAAVVGAVDAAITLIDKLAPSIKAMVSKGEISVETQAALDKRVAALRPGGTAFAGPEWEVVK